MTTNVWTNGANENIDLLHSVLREIHEWIVVTLPI